MFSVVPWSESHFSGIYITGKSVVRDQVPIWCACQARYYTHSHKVHLSKNKSKMSNKNTHNCYEILIKLNKHYRKRVNTQNMYTYRNSNRYCKA